MAESMVNLILCKFADTVIQEALYLYGVQDKVARVQRELTWIQCFLKDADSKRQKDERVKQWVNEVMEVSHCIEDILDKFLAEHGGGRQKGLHNKLQRIGKMPMELITKHKLVAKIDKILQRISEISESTKRYGIEGLKGNTSDSSVKQTISPLVIPDIDETEVVGFQVDQKIIVDKLTDRNISRRSVITLVGCGGSGKTTLAKEVYKR
ncbi:hypothetical protein LUZ61_007597 [Rhynchospora tenuis]|uniref:Disease resistance protein n=1 Tax=Rhynchospora tenuis TaxID=198213 RepID=A0AAD5ZTQ6_9POAL|nr:hypothetical protein LUZ61_007597 [Rhynchospora tenuis]